MNNIISEGEVVMFTSLRLIFNHTKKHGCLNMTIIQLACLLSLRKPLNYEYFCMQVQTCLNLNVSRCLEQTGFINQNYLCSLLSCLPLSWLAP